MRDSRVARSNRVGKVEGRDGARPGGDDNYGAIGLTRRQDSYWGRRCGASRRTSASPLPWFAGWSWGLLPWTRTWDSGRVAVVNVTGGLWEGRRATQ